MLMVMDIGNTNITIGIYKKNQLLASYRLTTKMKRTSDEYGFMIMSYLNAAHIDENGIFEYGLITLGIEASAQALWTQTAKLPEIEIKKPKTILNKSTITSMQAGLVYGYIGQSEYIIQKMKDELHTEMKVVATGGLGKIIYQNTTMIDVYDPDLTFKGLKYIYEKQQERNNNDDKSR